MKGHRKETFNAALEQAEQLFRAAGAVGTEARPILAFYGLSQVGRAVAAASVRLDGNDYRLKTHGIEDGQLEGAAARGLATLTVRGRATGSFPTVCHALGASPLRAERTIGELWGLIPDAARFPLPGAGTVRRLHLSPESRSLVRTSDWCRVVISGVPVELLGGEPAATVQEQLHQSNHDQELIKAEKAALRTWLESYPSLRGWEFVHHTDPEAPIGYRLADDGSLSVPLRLLQSDVETDAEVLRRVAAPYHGVHSVYPALDDTGLAAHPLMLWWAVLFSLSRFARYEPRDWVDMIDVSKSKHAAAIEYLLSEALLALPELAHSSILEAAELALPEQ